MQGECMQRLAECILEACSALPDSELSAAVEADARSNAKILFRQSVDAYKKVSSHVHHIGQHIGHFAYAVNHVLERHIFASLGCYSTDMTASHDGDMP